MEPSFWITGLSWCLSHLVPFVAFFFGVFISIKLKLNGELRGWHVFLMSIPVGLLTIGTLLLSSTVEINGPNIGESITKYGHMNSEAQFFVFIGTVMLYGTLVPQLFNQTRRRIVDEEIDVDKPGSRDTGK